MLASDLRARNEHRCRPLCGATPAASHCPRWPRSANTTSPSTVGFALTSAPSAYRAAPAPAPFPQRPRSANTSPATTVSFALTPALSASMAAPAPLLA